MQTPYQAFNGRPCWRSRVREYAIHFAAQIHRRLALLFLVFGVGLAGQTFAETTGRAQQGLITLGQVKFWTGNGNRIPMCWDVIDGFADQQAAAAAQSFVVQTIEEGWANPLGLHVTWEKCPSSGSQLHVRTLLRIGDATFNGNTVKFGMDTLTSWRQRIKYVRPASRLPKNQPGLLMGIRSDWNQNVFTRASFRSLVLHEFGHILGFAHEQKSNDSGGDSTCPDERISNRINVGPADGLSIMGWGGDYCKFSLGVLTPADVRAARTIYGVGRSSSTDFNSDGRADILWHNATTLEAQIWFMAGAQRIGRATITSGGQPARIGLPFRIVASRDFNRDGKADILWHNGATGETQLWFMDGPTLVDRATVVDTNGAAFLVGLPWSIVATSDINRDGRTDIVWHNAASGETQVWFMDRHRVVDRQTVQDEHGKPMLVGAPWHIVGANDMNFDGWADIVWHNASSNETQIWFMLNHRIIDRRTVVAEDGQPMRVGLPWQITGSDDYNLDGSADILWHNDATGETQIWFMRKAKVVRRATVDAVLDGEAIPMVGLPWRIAANLPSRP